MNKYDIVLAGLLHDIGKFFEKANSKGSSISGVEISTVDYGHGVTSSNFINHFGDKLTQAGFDLEAVATLAQRHHEVRGGGPASVEDAPVKYRPYCYIIDKADNLSSSERLNTDGGKRKDYQLRRITNIFSLLAGKRYSQEAGIYNQVYGKVSDAEMLNDASTNKSMVEAFVNEFTEIDTQGKAGVDGQRAFIDKVAKLLKKYTWCYPSDTTEYIRDISLYSHLQTTAAIAGVLYGDLTTNPEYKRGLGQDKSKLGWEFTEVSIKELRTQRVELVKIHLANAMDIVSSASVTDIPKIMAWLMDCKLNLTNEIYRELGITSVNCLCSDDYSSLFIVRDGDAGKVVSIVKKFNRSIPQFVGKLIVYFEVANSKLDLDELVSNDTGEIISNLNNAVVNQWGNPRCGVEYTGINSLMISDDGGWGRVGIGNIGTVSSFSTYKSLKKSQGEVADKLKAKVFAMVRVRVDNYDEVMLRLMSMNFEEANSIIKSDAKDKRVGTICRVSAMMDQVSRMIGLEFKECIYLYRGQNGIILLTTLDNAFRVGASHQRIISKQSIEALKTSLFIETVYGGDVDYTFRKITQLDRTHSKPGIICYNGIKLTNDQFNKIPNYMSMVSETANLKSSKGNLYKLIEFIGMYESYCRTGDTHLLMCIPRFNYNATRNFTNDSITKQFEEMVKSEFTKISQMDKPGDTSSDLPLIKQVIYDTLQTLRA